jgi:hypothetical protein
MKTEEDEEFERIEAESGWRKKQIALEEKAENARELGLDYAWVGLTKEDVDSWELPDTPTVAEFAWFVEAKLKEKNT